jgi:RND family efflux transporter MFP subunit|tara:strand:- start:308 stop:1498 length:1191 start_codon:yes stop_codon:yes gene_type:complete
VKRLVLAFLSVGFLVACSEEPRVVYQTVTGFTPVKTEYYEVDRFFIGRVSASQQANISFETQGVAEELLVDQGHRVIKGQALAKLDISLLKTQSNELAAQLRETKSRKKLAENSLRRQIDLNANGFTAEQRIDELTSEVESLAASESRLKASFNANVIRLKKGVLKAPFGGVVSRRFIDAGTVVDPSQPIFQIIDEGDLELKVGIPAGLVGSLVAGNSYITEIDGVNTSAIFISAAAHLDQITQSVPVRFALTDADARDGQTAVVSISNKQQVAGFWVPITSVTEGMRGSWVVYGLEGKSALRTLTQSAVEILHVDDDRFYVKADITGDIVASGMHKVVPGQLVELVVIEAEQAAIIEISDIAGDLAVVENVGLGEQQLIVPEATEAAQSSAVVAQ